jgi:enoyl-CoA hydratase/carnithine racemase
MATDAASSLVELSVADGVATVALNRPAVRNALDDTTREALMDTLDRVAADRSIRALVLTGNGKAFCAGGDIRAMKQRAAAPPGEIAFNGWSRQQRTHRAVSLLHALPKPTIAAVNGAATGLGADLAMCCDFVIASSAATFAWNYVLRGLIPDGGGLYFLPRRIGLVRAKELIFSGRTVAADEALRLGIADRLAAPESLLAAARAWAAELAQGGAEAVALSKSIIDRSFELPPEEIFAKGSQAQGILYTTTRHQEAIAAFLDKGK